MAADWIKMRIDLRDDPEVFRLSTMLKVDRYSIVGRLHAFWSWWDEKSRNGRVDGAVTVACDDVAGLQGFGDAMLVVGWLGQDDKGLYIPKWEKHNGRPAKDRALGKQRQESYRARNGTSNANVTKASRNSNAESVTRRRSSSSNKHLPVTTSTSTAQPPRTATPVEEPPRPTHPPEPTARETFPAEGVAAFAAKHGVKTSRKLERFE